MIPDAPEPGRSRATADPASDPRGASPSRAAAAVAIPVATVLLAAAALGWLSLGDFVPLTYDEAWNFLHLSSVGPAQVLGHYEVPNNHFLFTMVQMLLPARAVFAHPHGIRVPNLVVVLFALGTMTYLLRGRGWTRAALLSIAIALCSPIFTLYLLVARGYLLAFVLALVGVALATRRRFGWAGVALGLSASSVPTFAFVVPGIVAASWLVERDQRVRHSVRLVTPVLVIGALLYGPHARSVASHAKTWNAGVTPLELLERTAPWVANGTYVSLGLAAALVVAGLAARRRTAPPLTTTEAPFLLLGCASFYGVVALGAATRLANVPFARNAMFVPPFLWLSFLLLARGAPGWGRTAATALVVLNAVVGASLLSRFVASGADPDAYPFFDELTATASDRIPIVAAGVRLSAVGFEGNAEPVARLYAAAARLPLRTMEADAPGTCGVGTVPSRRGKRVWAVTAEATPLLLCR